MSSSNSPYFLFPGFHLLTSLVDDAMVANFMFGNLGVWYVLSLFFFTVISFSVF